MTTTTAAIYLRKSRADLEAESRGEGETLERHRRALLEVAKRQNISIGEIYREIVSGDTIAARPEMQRLLADVESGRWHGVLVMDVDRLSRGSTVDQGIVAQTFKFSNTLIITPAKTYDPNNEFDEEYFEFGLFMSRREYKIINRRLQRGRQASAKEGKFMGSIAPYGYKRVRLDNAKGVTLEVVPEQAEVIKLIFDLYIRGDDIRRYGIQALARRLNELKIEPVRHDYWQKETVREILSNPTYAGKIRWGFYKSKKRPDGTTSYKRPMVWNEDCVISDGLHEPIIPFELFLTAQNLLAECPPAPVGYKSAIKNPLAGLVMCGKCGRSMVLRRGKPPKPDYLVCHARACDNVSSRFDLAEKRVLDTLRLWYAKYSVEWNAGQRDERQNTSADALTKAIAATENEIAALTRQLSNTHDLLEREVYSIETFIDRAKELTERKTQAEQDLTALRENLNKNRKREDAAASLLPRIGKLLEI